MRDRANWYTRTLVYFTLIIEAAGSFEMLFHIHQTKQRHILSPDSLFTVIYELNSNWNRIHGSLTHEHVCNLCQEQNTWIIIQDNPRFVESVLKSTDIFPTLKHATVIHHFHCILKCPRYLFLCIVTILSRNGHWKGATSKTMFPKLLMSFVFVRKASGTHSGSAKFEWR
jgi:hypothetical protein